jgi:hypothetical protein
MDQNQKGQFRKAVEDKERAAAESAQAHERQLIENDEAPDSYDQRAKSTGHGKKTADKWNQ